MQLKVKPVHIFKLQQNLEKSPSGDHTKYTNIPSLSIIQFNFTMVLLLEMLMKFFIPFSVFLPKNKNNVDYEAQLKATVHLEQVTQVMLHYSLKSFLTNIYF